jgi:hypothetical protein
MGQRNHAEWQLVVPERAAVGEPVRGRRPQRRCDLSGQPSSPVRVNVTESQSGSVLGSTLME